MTMQERTAITTSPDWESLRIFLEVARSGSARGAADALGIHYTSISRRVDALERQAGGRLFDRSQKGFALTALGQSIQRHAEQMESAAHALVRQISGADTRLTGSLTLATTTTLAAYLLADDLAAFCQEHPGLSLQIRTGYQFADLIRGEADVIIRASNSPGDQLVGKRLATYHEHVYGTPAYLERHSPWQREPDCVWIDWRTEEAARKRHKVGTFQNVDRFMQVGDEVLLLELVRNGLGIGTVPCFYGDSTPGLVRVGDAAPWPMLGVWLLTHPDLVNNARVRAFVDFFTEALARKAPRLAGITPTR